MLSVPSSSLMASSTALRSVTSMPLSLGEMSSRTFLTALSTPFPEYLFPPSRSSRASKVPVDAPEGAMAVTVTFPASTCASTVGLPLESSTSLLQTLVIVTSAILCSSIAH